MPFEAEVRKVRQQSEKRTVGEEGMTNRQGMLPKPVRMFSYLFFGAVILFGVCEWLVKSG